ncbi:MAG: branched-chain amino acid transport system ATP-binding protein livM [Blastococcus sp.]|jgi:branched-chain amino acid transport system permease protein|nr:branched-chain amino acid transport system ATP-binding protein livM [Blastococcus sp.]
MTAVDRVRSLTAGRWGKLGPLLLFVVLIGYPVVFPFAIYEQGVLLLAFLLAIMAVSWNIVSGFAGYVSLGHSVFLGLGAYTGGLLAEKFQVNPLWFLPVGGLVAFVAAVLVGSVVLRARGHAFVIITIALLLAMQVLVNNFSTVTHGSDGVNVPLPFWSTDYQNLPFYYMFLVLLLATVAFAAWVRRTKFGTGLLAIREDEDKAAAIGVNTTRYKVLAYAASAVPIGIAGVVYAYFLSFLNPIGAFSLLTSVTIVLSALLGGRGTLWGPVLGAFVVSIVTEVANVYGGGSQSRLLVLGIALVAVVLFLPAGVLPAISARLARRRAAQEKVEYTDQAGVATARTPIVVSPRQAAVEQPAGAPRPLLEIRGAARSFGGLRAVDGVDLAVDAGSITALIGPNGSGKTTLFNLVTGAMPLGGGEIWFDGTRIDQLAPWQRAHLGLGRTFQITRLFKSMSVLENVVAPLPTSGWGLLAKDAVSGHEADRARELLDFVGLGRFGAQQAGALSYGQQKLVELAQVLMLEPKMILLDEPAGGINPTLVNRMVEIIRDLNRQGIAFLVVEHNIPLVLDLCNPVAVLSRGKVIAQGPPSIVRADPLVLEAYLGPEWLPAEPAPGPVLHPAGASVKGG